MICLPKCVNQMHDLLIFFISKTTIIKLKLCMLLDHEKKKKKQK